MALTGAGTIAFTDTALAVPAVGLFAFTFGVVFAFKAIAFAAGLTIFRVGAPFPRITALVLGVAVPFTAVFFAATFFPFAALLAVVPLTYCTVFFTGFLLVGFFFAVAILASLSSKMITKTKNLHPLQGRRFSPRYHPNSVEGLKVSGCRFNFSTLNLPTFKRS
jgi:hypothetical protein